MAEQMELENSADSALDSENPPAGSSPPKRKMSAESEDELVNMAQVEENSLNTSSSKKLKSLDDSNSKESKYPPLSEEFQGRIIEEFWQRTDRKKKSKLTMEEFGPDQFHHWGKLNQIMLGSPTLKEIVKTNGLRKVQNYKETFNKILQELDFRYRIVQTKTFKPKDHACMYDVDSVPPWSFSGYGGTMQEAINMAAEKGLFFFTALCI